MPTPIFELKMDHYYHGAWRADFDAGDFLALMWLDAGVWFFRYRFRYYVDEKVWESKDHRRVYEFKLLDSPEAKAKMFSTIHELMNVIAASGMIDHLEYFPCDGNGEAMAKILTSGINGVHFKKMSKEQFEEYQRTDQIPKGVE